MKPKEAPIHNAFLVVLLAFSWAGCGSSTKKEVDEPLIQGQTFLAAPVESSVTIDKDMENERTLIVRSRFPLAPSKHGSDDGIDSRAFLDFSLFPQREATPNREELGSYPQFFFQIGRNNMGESYSSDEELALAYHSYANGIALTETLRIFSESPLRFVQRDYYSSGEEYFERVYFHRIADHRSLTIVLTSKIPFDQLWNVQLAEIEGTIRSIEVRAAN